MLAKRLPKSKFWSKFVLKNQAKTDLGFTSAIDYSLLVGQEGTALTQLRPAGTAIIAGKQVDVVSEGQYISAHEKIIVTTVSGRRVVVEKISKKD